MYDEVTASSLVKVSQHGDVLDNGSTTLGVDRIAVSVHAAAYAANSNLNCIVHIASSPAVSVS
jgi:ribulose-5-phosphate 4-epimerase/fuculose-1-phosphate aldolase